MTKANAAFRDGDRPRLQIRIRTMTIDDLAPIFHLGEDLFTPDLYPNLYRTWDEYEVTSRFQTDAETCFVAEIEDRMAGFLLGTVIEKPRTAWNYGYVYWLGVMPGLQGQGVASALFDRFQDHMEEINVRMLLVDTQKANKPALRFFEGKGFRNPTEHVYMTKHIKSDPED